MQITITLDTANLTEQDKATLLALTGAENGVSAPKAAAKPEAKAPAAKAAPKAAKPAPEPDPEPEPEEDEDLVGGDDEQGEDKVFTMADATALATKLVQGGKAAEVKKVLTDLGAKRVSELAESDIPAFMSALA